MTTQSSKYDPSLENEFDNFDYSEIRAEMLKQEISTGEGPFDESVESLQQFKCPDWFRDAKFGIWAHWGPQCLTMSGDWYARNLYLRDACPDIANYHLEHFGHPSEVGYKDTIKYWQAEKFDPEALMKLYKSAGAKYFMALGVHTDNFDCWNSKYHRWNSVNLGPHKDIVGMWSKAARAEGLKFGVSEHYSNYYHWFGPSRGTDKVGALKGVPYDGNDPKYQDLYNCRFVDDPQEWLTPDDYPKDWAKEWYFRMQDLLDQFEPDLFYTDGALALDEYSRSILAYYYNENMKRNGGELDAVYTQKNHPGLGTYIEGVGVFDIERGLTGGILEEPWQIDTCLGDWFYKEGIVYKTPEMMIHFLIDVVSKNGNMMLSVPIRPEGVVDEECQHILGEMGRWIEVNGEAIYGTRPWKVYGEGQQEVFEAKCHNEPALEPNPGECRFTQKTSADGSENVVYAFMLKAPESSELKIRSFAGEGDIQHIEMLGMGEVEWQKSATGLQVTLPATFSNKYASVLKIICE